MKKRTKFLSIMAVFALTLLIGLKLNETTAKAMTTENYYLQGGETLSINVSSTKNPVLDWANMNKSDGSIKFGYKKGDSTKYLTLLTDSSKTKKIQACNVYGCYTFYINKNGDTNNDNRVRQINIHIYKIPGNNSTTGLTNSTSATNGSYANVPVYLYKGQTSVLYNNHYDTWGPWSMTDTAGKGATIYVSGRSSSNTSVATISASGNNHIVKAGNTAGSSTIRVTMSWKSSNGTVHSVYRDIMVYVYDKPTFAIYKVDGDKEYKCTNNQYFTWMDIGGMVHSYKYTYKATYPSGMTLASVNCTTPDSNTLSISRSGTYTTFTPKSHYINQLVTFSFVVNSPVKTHNGNNASTFNLSYYTSFIESNDSYATDIKFEHSSASTSLAKTYTQKAKVVPEDALNAIVYYSVDDEEIASIDRLTGEVTPKKVGKVKVCGQSATNEKVKDYYTLTINPNSPSGFNASKVNEGIRLAWAEVPQAKSYEIYRSTIRDGEYTKIGSTSVLFYVDTKVSYGTEYFYKIVAVCDGYKSENSNIVSINRTLDVPSISTVKKVSSGIYQITINGSLYDGFKIYDVQSNGSKVLLVSTTSKYATVALENNKVYKLVVRSYKTVNDSLIYSAYSPELRVTIGTPNASANTNNNTIIQYLTKENIKYIISDNVVKLKDEPKSFKLKNTKYKTKRGNKRKTIQVGWKKNKKIKANVQIKYSTSKKFANSKTSYKLIDASKGKYKLKGLKAGKTYYIKIRYRKKVNGYYVYSKYTSVKSLKVK